MAIKFVFSCSYWHQYYTVVWEGS